MTESAPDKLKFAETVPATSNSAEESKIPTLPPKNKAAYLFPPSNVVISPTSTCKPTAPARFNSIVFHLFQY